MILNTWNWHALKSEGKAFLKVEISGFLVQKRDSLNLAPLAFSCEKVNCIFHISMQSALPNASCHWQKRPLHGSGPSQPLLRLAQVQHVCVYATHLHLHLPNSQIALGNSVENNPFPRKLPDPAQRPGKSSALDTLPGVLKDSLLLYFVSQEPEVP